MEVGGRIKGVFMTLYGSRGTHQGCIYDIIWKQGDALKGVFMTLYGSRGRIKGVFMTLYGSRGTH